MGNEAEPKGRPRRLGIVAVAMIALLAVIDVDAEEEAASDDSASDELPLSASV